MIPANKGKTYDPDPLTPDEVHALLMACNVRYRTGLRNRAHIALMWRCGLRPRESCAVRLADIRWGNGDGATLRVMEPKNKKRGAPLRTVGIDAELERLLLRWIGERGIEPGPLFTTATGSSVHTSYLRELLPRLGRRAGIVRRVHPHGMRHTNARELYEETRDVKLIQDHLGHANLGTTDAYLRNRLGCTEAAEVVAGRSWAR